jgi:predicted DNA-binding antitoxin AbrB/MazE fold protein
MDAMTIHAIYENGVFIPQEKVDLPEKTVVTIDPQPVLPFDEEKALKGMKRVIEALNMRCASGDHDVAERHNEHQP